MRLRGSMTKQISDSSTDEEIEAFLNKELKICDPEYGDFTLLPPKNPSKDRCKMFRQLWKELNEGKYD